MTSLTHPYILLYFFILSTSDKHDKMQLLAKFKKNSVHGVQSHLKFSKVALNPVYRIFLNFAKSCVLSCLSKVDNIKTFHDTIF